MDQFESAGFSLRSALRKAELLGDCVRVLRCQTPAYVLYVPGRLEVIGKHTDYAGGRSITCALDRGIVVAIQPRADSHCLIHACDLRESAGFDLHAELQPPASGWSNYVMSVGRRLARNFGTPLVGADIAFASDLPHAGGMSSSSALVVATYLALNWVNRFDERPAYREEIHNIHDLAGYLGACENGQSFGKLVGDRGVGTYGGSEDHTAILCSKPGQLSMYSYNPVRLERRLEMPAELALVIGVSGVVAEKTAAARERYNLIAQQMSAIMEVLRAQGWSKPTLAAAIGDDAGATQCVAQILSKSRHPFFKPAALLARFEQFAQEHQRLAPQVMDGLERRDFSGVSMAAETSQALAESNLGNQVPETIALVRSAKQLHAAAASAFGAGFGGSVWAMINRDDVEAFIAQWHEQYLATFPEHAPRAKFFTTEPMGGAMLL